jgi:hypothetical protein
MRDWPPEIILIIEFVGTKQAWVNDPKELGVLETTMRQECPVKMLALRNLAFVQLKKN